MFKLKQELYALAIVFLILVAFPASLLAYQAWRTSPGDARVIELVGSSPANGGWKPDSIRVNVGERVRLRISSPDVIHGFEVPALAIKVDEILPGHVQEIVFTATQVGRFPFACTRWCSPDHWRMRGTIEVVDPANPNPARPTFAPPLFQQMKMDIDAMHPAQNVPARRPSSARGALLNLAVDASSNAQEFRTLSPSDVFGKLRRDPAFSSYDDGALWDAVAFAYQRAAGDASIARGQKLFARDCAACHGEGGKGNGTAGINLPGMQAMDPKMKRGPADFTDASQLLGASDILLQGKILRGGMGTGMPEWGSLYTDQDMWDVIVYLRSFQFEYSALR